MTFPPIRPQLTPCVLAALGVDPESLADVCRKVGRDPRDRSVRRALHTLALDGRARWTEDGWAAAAPGARREPTAQPSGDPNALLAADIAGEVDAALDRAFEGEAKEPSRHALRRMADEDAEFWRQLHERTAAERADDARLLARLNRLVAAEDSAGPDDEDDLA